MKFSLQHWMDSVRWSLMFSIEENENSEQRMEKWTTKKWYLMGLWQEREYNVSCSCHSPWVYSSMTSPRYVFSTHGDEHKSCCCLSCIHMFTSSSSWKTTLELAHVIMRVRLQLEWQVVQSMIPHLAQRLNVIPFSKSVEARCEMDGAYPHL